MNRPLLIGITGGIGAGKSTITRIFSSLGVPVYYADDRGKWLLSNDFHVKEQVTSAFGSEVYTSEGKINSKLLADQVFPDKEKLEILNGIVHPAVRRDFSEFIVENGSSKYVIKEAALLFETGSYKELNKTILVTANKNLRINRVLIRDHQRSKEQIEQIIEKQLSESKKKELADFLINNNEDELVIPQVMSIHSRIIKLLEG